jgi:hypothetical protein
MNTNKLNFNDWMDHIARELQNDRRKLYITSQIKQDANIQRVSRAKSQDLRRVQTLRLFADQ